MSYEQKRYPRTQIVHDDIRDYFSFVIHASDDIQSFVKNKARVAVSSGRVFGIFRKLLTHTVPRVFRKIIDECFL